MSSGRPIQRYRTPSKDVSGDEDELVSSGPLRVTPHLRSSDRTPYSRLKQLAEVVQNTTTPSQRSAKTTSTSTRKPSDRTTPNSVRGTSLNRPSRPIPGKRGEPTTPHAIRALRQRAAAAVTPGRGRRKSGRQQRDTPRDLLRKLSRVEAAVSKPIIQTPSIVETGDLDDVDEEDEDAPVRPRLSVPLDENEEDSFQAPPRFSLPIDDEDLSVLSVERPRRDYSELGRYGIDERLSERFDQAENSSGEDSDLEDSRMTAGFDDLYDQQGNIIDDIDNTADLRQIVERSRAGLGAEDATATFPFNADSSFAIDVPDTTVQLQDPSIRIRSPEVELLPSDSEIDHNIQEETPRVLKPKPQRIKRSKRSRHGIDYSVLPTGVIKKLLNSILNPTGKKRGGINKDLLKTVEVTSDWFFEQVGNDLGAFASHAGRRIIDETDVMTLMKRQRLLNTTTTPFSLAQKHLPREYIQEMKMKRERGIS